MSRFATWLGAMLSAAALNSALLAVPAAGAEMTLEELIQAVRENELLYANIDLTIRNSFESFVKHPPGKGGSFDGMFEFRTMTAEEVKSRFVAQGQYFRYEEDSHFTTSDGEQHNYVHTSAFDGETTRLCNNGVIANIAKGYKPAGVPIWPHNIFLRMVGRTEHLSSYLGGDAAIARDPYGYTSSESERTTEYVGPAEFQGLRCQVVRSVTRVRVSGQTAGHTELWLAEDRNFIPVRHIACEHRISATEPTGEGVVLEWQELQPGIWFPMRVESDCIDQPTAILKGKRVPGWRREYVVESISLEPKHDRSFFRDVPIPDGTIVYEIEGDRITRSYTKGGPGAQGGPAKTPAGSPWRTLAIFGTVVIVGVTCIGYVHRKRRHRLQQSTP